MTQKRKNCSGQRYPEPAGQTNSSARFSANVKICVTVYIISVLFMLFLLVMHIWVDLYVSA
jgi:hypothetical protein